MSNIIVRGDSMMTEKGYICADGRGLTQDEINSIMPGGVSYVLDETPIAIINEPYKGRGTDTCAYVLIDNNTVIEHVYFKST